MNVIMLNHKLNNNTGAMESTFANDYETPMDWMSQGHAVVLSYRADGSEDDIRTEVMAELNARPVGEPKLSANGMFYNQVIAKRAPWDRK